LLPTVEIETPLVVVQHVGEAIKPTNTVRLLRAMVPSVVTLPWGLRDVAFDPSPLQTGPEYRIVFLRDDASVVESVEPGQGFVLLDGTWHQCSRMARRVPHVADLPCVALPEGPPSIWVRTQHDERGLSTFEAAVRLIALAEGNAVVQPLMRAFAIVTARLLFMKGRLPSPDVPSTWPIDGLD
jgi:DTW domain-containing protein YfiP